VLIVTLTVLPLVYSVPVSNDTTDPRITVRMQTTTPVPRAVVPDIVLTLAFIGVCALLGIGIARCADVVYDKHVDRYSKKVVDDNTRKLLRARVAIMRMKADPKTSELRSANKAATKWMAKTAGPKTDTTNMKDPNIVNEIGKPHLPGILVESAEESQRKIDSHKVDHDQVQTTDSKPKTSTNSGKELHPVEKITVKIKPGGPLPPVSVHDSPIGSAK